LSHDQSRRPAMSTQRRPLWSPGLARLLTSPRAWAPTRGPFGRSALSRLVGTEHAHGLLRKRPVDDLVDGDLAAHKPAFLEELKVVAQTLDLQAAVGIDRESVHRGVGVAILDLGRFGENRDDLIRIRPGEPAVLERVVIVAHGADIGVEEFLRHRPALL